MRLKILFILLLCACSNYLFSLSIDIKNVKTNKIEKNIQIPDYRIIENGVNLVNKIYNEAYNYISKNEVKYIITVKTADNEITITPISKDIFTFEMIIKKQNSLQEFTGDNTGVKNTIEKNFDDKFRIIHVSKKEQDKFIFESSFLYIDDILREVYELNLDEAYFTEYSETGILLSKTTSNNDRLVNQIFTDYSADKNVDYNVDYVNNKITETIKTNENVISEKLFIITSIEKIQNLLDLQTLLGKLTPQSHKTYLYNNNKISEFKITDKDGTTLEKYEYGDSFLSWKVYFNDLLIEEHKKQDNNEIIVIYFNGKPMISQTYENGELIHEEKFK